MSDNQAKNTAVPPTSPDQPLRIFHGPSTGFYQYASAVAWSPDGEQLAAAFGDQTIRIWQSESGNLVHILEGHRDEINALTWAPDGRRLASASYDGTALIWEAASGNILLTLQPGRMSVLSLAWSPDGQWLAAAGAAPKGSWPDPRPIYHVSLWNAFSGELVRQTTQATGGEQSVTWSPDSQRLASGGFDRLLRIWNAASGDLALTLEGQGSPINAVAWAPGGAWLASGGGDPYEVRTEDAVCLWDSMTGALLRRFPGHNRVAHAVAWAPDGRRLASAGGNLYVGEGSPPSDVPDYTVRIWDASTGHLLTMLHGHTHEVNALAWSPDDQHLASASSDFTVRVWRVG